MFICPICREGFHYLNDARLHECQEPLTIEGQRDQFERRLDALFDRADRDRKIERGE